MKNLDARLRAEWNALVESEGKSLGLSDCSPFLENKMVNDIFYEGKFKGRDCIVKCSSKAPDSILNEYALSKRVYATNPSVTPEPLACYATDDGRMAFIVTAKAKGLSLTELLRSGISDDAAASYASDILHLANALSATGVVHRDLFTDNLLLDADGHIKAIDFQFAIDQNNYCECRWMQRNWKYRYVVFGVNHDLGLGVWNDAEALVRILTMLPQVDAVKSAVFRLSKCGKDGSFKAPPGILCRCAIFFYAVSLGAQLLLKKDNFKKRDRIRNRLSRIADLQWTRLHPRKSVVFRFQGE